MIVLNEEGHFVVIESWNDILERPAYRENVSEKEIKLKTIIGKYRLYPKMKCGLKGCRTPHNRGYLVKCEGGAEIKLGHRCGNRIFGVDFQLLENTFKRDSNAQKYRQNIVKLQNQHDSYSKLIKKLHEGDRNGSWCVEKMRKHASVVFDQKTEDALLERARRGDSIITREVKLEGRELEAAKEMNAPLVEIENLAIIRGLSALKDFSKLKNLLNVRLNEEFATFFSLDTDLMDYSSLQRWDRWSKLLKKNISQAEQIIEESKRFLDSENLQTIRSHKSYL